MTKLELLSILLATLLDLTSLTLGSYAKQQSLDVLVVHQSTSKTFAWSGKAIKRPG